MNNLIKSVLVAMILIAPSAASAQTFKRTTFKADKLDFGMGGTVTLVGAARGSITVEGWQNAQIEIQAEIENEAANAADLEKMAAINGFALDEAFGHIRINSVGVDDKALLKKLGLKVSKEVAASPYRINYKIKVPRFTDLNINGGEGAFILRDVDGTIRINFAKTDADLSLAGGAILATFGEGNVNITIPTRGWRGRFADVQLASGKLNLSLPPVFDAEVNASILREGSVENAYEPLKPKPRSSFTEKSVVGKTGNGGVELRLTVGDGSVRISQIP